MPTVQSYCVTLTGTPYENGKALGRFVLDDPHLHGVLSDRLRWFDACDRSKIDFDGAEVCVRTYRQRLPSLFEEIRGFAEVLQIPYEKYLDYFLFDWEIPSHCSQFTVLPELTQDKKVFAGHSWEWTLKAPTADRIQTLEEDNIFIIAKNAHRAFMGFSLNCFGLWNGMNDSGLSVNPTGLIFKEPQATKTLHNHGLLVRIILETCHTADEALAVIEELMPLQRGGGGTLMVTDRSGKCTYFERVEDKIGCLEVGKDTDRQYQCATNHPVIPGMRSANSFKGVQSVIRYDAIARWIEEHKGQITMKALLDMQESPFPDGPCCHFYSAYLGTVRSMVYDLADRKAMVCFGSHRLNPWHAYDFDAAGPAVRSFATTYVDEEADRGIWQEVQ